MSYTETAYCTEEEMCSKIDADVLAELQKVTGDIDAARMDGARELDGRLCSRYVTPITGEQSLAILRGKNAAISKYFILLRKLSVGNLLVADAKGDYIAALDWAAGVAKKTYSLPDAPIVVAPPTSVTLARATGVMVGGAKAVFGDDTMLRF